MQKTKLEIDSLIKLFYSDSPKKLGTFQEIESKIMPISYRKLLDHNSHMTVIIEEHHKSPATLVVLDTLKTTNHYSRKILQKKEPDGLPVLFAIAHINFKVLDENVKNKIQEEKIALGHILLKSNLRISLQRISLFKIIPSKDLIKFFKINNLKNTFCYGRTAVISCDDVPTVELLEIIPA